MTAWYTDKNQPCEDKELNYRLTEITTGCQRWHCLFFTNLEYEWIYSIHKYKEFELFKCWCSTMICTWHVCIWPLHQWFNLKKQTNKQKTFFEFLTLKRFPIWTHVLLHDVGVNCPFVISLVLFPSHCPQCYSVHSDCLSSSLSLASTSWFRIVWLVGWEEAGSTEPKKSEQNWERQ